MEKISFEKRPEGCVTLSALSYYKKPEIRCEANILIPAEREGGRFLAISYRRRAPRLHTFLLL